MKAVVRMKFVGESPEDDIEVVNQLDGDLMVVNQGDHRLLIPTKDVESFARKLVNFAEFAGRIEAQ